MRAARNGRSRQGNRGALSADVASMSILKLLLVPVLLSAACTRGHEPVYRYINVTGGRIALGQPLGKLYNAEPVDDTTYRLRPGTFAGGGTTSIVVFTDRGDTVRSMRFTYDGTESLTDKIRGYVGSLGPPKQWGEEGQEKLYVWEDPRTRFEIHFSREKGGEFWSSLIDRRGS